MVDLWGKEWFSVAFQVERGKISKAKKKTKGGGGKEKRDLQRKERNSHPGSTYHHLTQSKEKAESGTSSRKQGKISSQSKFEKKSEIEFTQKKGKGGKRGKNEPAQPSQKRGTH